MLPELDPDDLTNLADILGQEDAVWAPVRGIQGNSRGNAYLARGEFPAHGIRWEAGGGTAADRKRQQRWLEDAARRGLVVRHHAGGFAVRCKLTEPAEVAVRAACGLPGLAASADLVAEVGGYEFADPSEELWYAPGVWVPEYPTLTGPKDLRMWVEEMAYPSLRRGWLLANSNVQGLVRYSVGPVAVPPDLPADPPDGYREDVRAAWAAGLKRKLATLVAPGSYTSEIGSIALPVGWGRVQRKGRTKRAKRGKTAAG